MQRVPSGDVQLGGRGHNSVCVCVVCSGELQPFAGRCIVQGVYPLRSRNLQLWCWLVALYCLRLRDVQLCSWLHIVCSMSAVRCRVLQHCGRRRHVVMRVVHSGKVRACPRGSVASLVPAL